MVEGKRAWTSSVCQTRQGHMDQGRQPHALSISIQGQSGTSCFTNECRRQELCGAEAWCSSHSQWGCGWSSSCSGRCAQRPGPMYKCYLGKQLRKATTERWRNPVKMCDTKFKMKHCYSISKMFLVQMALILLAVTALQRPAEKLWTWKSHGMKGTFSPSSIVLQATFRKHVWV